LEDALGDRLLGEEAGPVHPEVADCRDASPQRAQHVGRALVGRDLRPVLERLAREIIGPVPRQVGMVVEQPWEDRRTWASELHRDITTRPEVGVTADAGDLRSLHPDETILEHVALAREHPPTDDQAPVVWRPRRHRSDLFEPPWRCFGHWTLLGSES